MSYDLKHTGEAIDAAIYAVERGSVVTENTAKEVTLGEAKPASADAIARELQKKVDKVEGKGLSTNDYTNEEKEQVAKIEGKQDTLTLTVKDNGNIVLGNIAGQSKEFMPATPSGDPMHYYYISEYGVTYNENTGFFELGYLKDLTATDMRNAVRVSSGNWGELFNASYYLQTPVRNEHKPRTNLAIYSGDIEAKKNEYPCNQSYLNQFIIGKCSGEIDAKLKNVWGSSVGFVFRIAGCPVMRYIVGVIDISTIPENSLSKLVASNTNLIEFKFAGLKVFQSLHFTNPSKESISYLLENRVNTDEISLGLMEVPYNKIMNDDGEWADLRPLLEATADKGAVILEKTA